MNPINSEDAYDHVYLSLAADGGGLTFRDSLGKLDPNRVPPVSFSVYLKCLYPNRTVSALELTLSDYQRKL